MGGEVDVVFMLRSANEQISGERDEALRERDEARQRAERMPWNTKELEGWSIIGMNHYFVGDERRLYVAMTDREVKRCIRAHGSSEAAVFMELRMQAAALAADQLTEVGS